MHQAVAGYSITLEYRLELQILGKLDRLAMFFILCPHMYHMPG